jgi:hypothetical protein
MTPERIIGILIHAVMNDQLTNRVMELPRSVSLKYYASPGQGWLDVPTFVFTASELPLSDRSLGMEDMLYSKIEGLIWAAEHPGEYRWEYCEEGEDE